MESFKLALTFAADLVWIGFALAWLAKFWRVKGLGGQEGAVYFIAMAVSLIAIM